MNHQPVISLIEARELSAGYGAIVVVRDLDLTVYPGEVVALLGANGAGKTTTLLSLAGQLRPRSGTVLFNGKPDNTPMHRRANRGMAFVSESRSVFTRLTAAQNLAIGRRCDVDRAMSLFPPLRALADRRGGLLSGGEQQMLTLARALARPTKLLLADELSLGLAPKSVDLLLAAVRRAADEGMGALVVEQHVHRVLQIADRVYVLRRGRVEFTGTAEEARSNLDEIQKHYLATGGGPNAHEHR